MQNTTTTTYAPEHIPSIGSTIAQRGHIADTQIVKGYTGNLPSDSHEPYSPSPWMTRCEPTPDGLVAPAIVCESGKIIPMDVFFFTWK